MWIDTHNHFDFPAFDKTRADDWMCAQALGVSAQFVMSVSPDNFSKVVDLSTQFDGTYFALGIHPLFINRLDLDIAIKVLRQAVALHINHPRFIGIGEIGLDFYTKDDDFNRQIDFFSAQLKIARDYDLPVFMHVRKSQDQLLKYCREFGVERGIAHAFNGSYQQAEQFIANGFKLGFGGAFTYPRAKQLRRLVCSLPLEAFVLETDAPDMSPEWISGAINYSYHLPNIAQHFANIRQVSITTLSKQLIENTNEVTNYQFH